MTLHEILSISVFGLYFDKLSTAIRIIRSRDFEKKSTWQTLGRTGLKQKSSLLFRLLLDKNLCKYIKQVKISVFTYFISQDTQKIGATLMRALGAFFHCYAPV